MQCTKCRKRAVIFRRYEGRALCRKHFFDSVDRTVRKTIRMEKQIPRGSHVAVGIYGDGDSALLLYLLCNLSKKRDDLKISAIVVDEGIKRYSKEVIRSAKKISGQAEVALYTVSYRDMFAMTLDEIMRKSKGEDLDRCAVCQSLRFVALGKKACGIGADRVALPVNMDDEVQAIISDYFCDGDDAGAITGQFTKKMPVIQMIKPLSRVLAGEAALYAKLKGLDAVPAECPYTRVSVRWKIKEVMDKLDKRHPGMKFNVVRANARFQKG
ncbi:MAG: hypothetical protein KAH93_03130 [Candidatus Aenigmarchaeota archaeon]|nr:hypothetical protein [Candidatus Aenigmarchaeota archaeon]